LEWLPVIVIEILALSVSPELTKARRTHTDWSPAISMLLDELIPWFRKEWIVPSLREIFYLLADKQKIPNTKSSYKQLSEHLVRLRMEGIVPWSAISDDTRLVHFDKLPKYMTAIEYVKEKINRVRLAHEEYKIPLWYSQPYYIEVWIEKLAAVRTVASYIKDKQVRLVPIRGYDSWTNIHKSSLRLKAKKQDGFKVAIIYLGDFDPSGEDIDRHTRQGLNYFGLKDIPINRIAVTKEQIQEFHLPPLPTDVETLDKLENKDKRTPGFIKKHGRLYAVELEALTLREEFKRLLIETIDKFYDKSIYQELISRPEYSSEAISGLESDKVPRCGR
jgi:hypothetical protein